MISRNDTTAALFGKQCRCKCLSVRKLRIQALMFRLCWEIHKVAADWQPCVQALPTLLLFRDGCAVDRIEGLMSEASLAQRIRFYIGRMDLKFGRR